MKAWKRTGKAIEMAEDRPQKGKWRRIANRIVRAQLKTQLIKEIKSAKVRS